MRITGGQWRGRAVPVLDSPITGLRPTGDKMRQAIFNFLQHNPDCLSVMPGLEGVSVLDAFCGSGALGLEALSRKAGFARFWDIDKPSIQVLRQWCTRHNVENYDIKQQDATDPQQAESAVDLVFLDPPYGQNLIPQALKSLSQNGWIRPGTLCVCEMDKADEAPDLDVMIDRYYGRSRLIIGTGKE